MKKNLLLLILVLISQYIAAQYVYTIKADSVKITNTCDTAELILENHTQLVPGFLFNKGRGRTEFRRGFITLNDSLYLIGADTLNINNALRSINANNGVLKTGNTFQFGNDNNDPYFGPAVQIRPTFYNQNAQLFNWITGNSAIFTVGKSLYNTTETNGLRNYHIARFAAPFQQGGLVIETQVAAGFSTPLSWMLWKNGNTNAPTLSFFSDTYSTALIIGGRGGVDGKTYHNFAFNIAGDTSSTGSGSALRLYPAFTSTSGGPIKMPTAVVKRLDITDPVPGSADNFFPLSYNNPYSRLVMDAKNFPVVMANLPVSSNDGRLLVVDNTGKVWQGDSTAALRNLPTSVKLASDITSTSSTPANAGALNFPVTAGTYYKFRFVVVFNSSDAGTGIKLGLTAPAFTVFSATADIPNAADGTGSRYQGWITASGDDVTSQGVQATGTDYIAMIEGVLVPSASGTLQLTFGSANSNQVTIRQGSLATIERY
jgi:hypothetical protein